jgi:hypothetical protein
MRKEEKKRIKINDVPYINLDLEMFTGDINEVAQRVIGIKKKLKEAIEFQKTRNPGITAFEDYKKIEIEISHHWDTSLSLHCERDETDEEFEKRIKRLETIKKSLALKSKKIKEGKEKKERELFERLKKKYGE